MSKKSADEDRVDMSPEAIARRLREASELRRLCLSLGKARRIPDDGPR